MIWMLLFYGWINRFPRERERELRSVSWRLEAGLVHSLDFPWSIHSFVDCPWSRHRNRPDSGGPALEYPQYVGDLGHRHLPRPPRFGLRRVDLKSPLWWIEKRRLRVLWNKCSCFVLLSLGIPSSNCDPRSQGFEFYSLAFKYGWFWGPDFSALGLIRVIGLFAGTLQMEPWVILSVNFGHWGGWTLFGSGLELRAHQCFGKK